jgi:hypothetical protein
MPRQRQYTNRIHIDLCTDLETYEKFKEKTYREHTSVSEKFTEMMREDIRRDEIQGPENLFNIQYNPIDSLSVQLLLRKTISRQRGEFLVNSIKDKKDVAIVHQNLVMLTELTRSRLYTHDIESTNNNHIAVSTEEIEGIKKTFDEEQAYNTSRAINDDKIET